MTDSHIHLGEFANGLYFTPEYLAEWKNQNRDIQKFLFIQTARSGDFDSAYADFLRDADKLQELVGSCALPALWLTLDAFKNCKKYFKDEFVAFKFHPRVESNLSDNDFDYVMKVSAEFNRPLIIHTSYDGAESCGRLTPICKKNPNTTIILAHGRPFEECPNAVKLPNVYADTAYMPPAEAKEIVDQGLGDKLLFGSDFPIDKYFYPEENDFLRYQEFKTQMQKILPKSALSDNFHKLFCNGITKESVKK